MIMSRAEIAAAARALHTGERRRSHSAAWTGAKRKTALVATLLYDCAERVRAEPIYRLSLVERLQQRIHTGTYSLSADEIAEQLLGRLMAAELST